MKQLFLISALLFSLQLSSQVVDIPDANFLEALIEEGVDSNGDGMIQEFEALTVDSLAVRGKSISSLSGIEYFLNLKHLDCYSNTLTILDISQNIDLEYLNCAQNVLVALDVSHNSNLGFLDCGVNWPMETLDVSQNYNLKHLSCCCIGLETLDLSQNLNLAYLYCTYNDLQFLDISQNINLEFINCSENRMEVLDLSKNIKLEHLDCQQNSLKVLDLSENLNLQYLECRDNNLEALDISQNLSYLDCARNSLNVLDVSQSFNLEFINCSVNDLEFLDLSENLNLEILYCGSNYLEDLDVSQNLNLNKLYCEGNILDFLDVSQNLNLTFLSCNYNNLQTLDVSKNLNLRSLICSNNDLEILDVSLNQNLSGLCCSFNSRLECLDLRDNSELAGLLIDNNMSLNRLFISSTNIILTINAENTDLQFICAPISMWAKFNQADISNAILTDECADFSCSEGLFQISGAIRSSSDDCELNNDIDYASIKYRVYIGTDTIEISNNTFNGYVFLLPEDSIRISPIFPNPDLFSMDPPYYDFYLSEDTDSLDFCFSPLGASKLDLSIDLYMTASPRPGFEHEYFIEFENIGNETSNGTIRYEFDPEQMSFVSSPDNWTIEGDELVLEYSELLPFEARTSSLLFKLNSPMDTPPLNGGEILCSTIALGPIENDCDQSNNNHSLKETVVNSYDPNDKTCLQGDYLDIDSLPSSLTYRIRFENTGTAEAINISIVDSIDINVFDIRTAKLIEASHEAQMKVEGNVLTFDLFDIYLPFEDDSNDGFIIFSIEPCSDLPLGIELSNKASIFFDFNFPIITNTSTTIVVEDLDQDGYYHIDDCDDINPNINPGNVEIVYNGLDDDCDPMTLDDDLDQDGYGIAEDCDESNPTIYNGAPELCDGLDNDCDESIDEDLAVESYYIDNDNDGYGEPLTLIERCEQPEGYVLNDGDCDDTNPSINPTAEDIPNNGIDENCDGMDAVSSTLELEHIAFTIAPNPVDHTLYISSSDKILTISIYDIQGKVLKSINAVQHQAYVLELNDFASGLYILKAEFEEGSKTLRFVKE